MMYQLLQIFPLLIVLLRKQVLVPNYLVDGVLLRVKCDGVAS